MDKLELLGLFPQELGEALAENYADQPVSLLEQRVSKLDGTRKLLYALRDGNCVEGVLMHYHHGYTLCLSTQVGCRMGCAFCASTLNGCVRSLSAAEMLGQVHCANRLIADDHISNIVLMGSGEPLDNYASGQPSGRVEYRIAPYIAEHLRPGAADEALCPRRAAGDAVAVPARAQRYHPPSADARGQRLCHGGCAGRLPLLY